MMPTLRRCGRISEEMSISCLMAAAQDNRDGAAVQYSGDDLCQRGLRLFQFTHYSHITQVQRGTVGELDIGLAIAWCEPVQLAANRVRGLCRTGPAAVAVHSFVLRKADDHGTARRERDRAALPEVGNFAETRVIRPANHVSWRHVPVQAACTTRPRLMTRQT